MKTIFLSIIKWIIIGAFIGTFIGLILEAVSVPMAIFMTVFGMALHDNKLFFSLPGMWEEIMYLPYIGSWYGAIVGFAGFLVKQALQLCYIKTKTRMS